MLSSSIYEGLDWVADRSSLLLHLHGVFYNFGMTCFGIDQQKQEIELDWMQTLLSFFKEELSISKSLRNSQKGASANLLETRNDNTAKDSTISKGLSQITNTILCEC